jgi:hypothetical protein
MFFPVLLYSGKLMELTHLRRRQLTLIPLVAARFGPRLNWRTLMHLTPLRKRKERKRKADWRRSGVLSPARMMAPIVKWFSEVMAKKTTFL